MEPITHFLTGACIGRAGLNRKTAYATLAAVLAAEAADIDVLWGLAGPVEELKHHRGITHTFIAVPVVAAAAVGMVWLFDRWMAARRRNRWLEIPAFHPSDQEPSLGTPALKGHGFSRAIEGPHDDPALAAEGMQLDDNSTPQSPTGFRRPTGHETVAPASRPAVAWTSRSTLVSYQGPKPEDSFALPAARLKPRPFKAEVPGSAQEIRWGWLYLTALLSALIHLLLDWTNNYGLRPFFPFNPRWYAGSFVFIAEPVLWALLGAALIIPALLGLIGGEIGAKKKEFRGRGWAIFALTGMVLLWGWRWAEHGRARALVENTEISTAPVKQMALEPYPINPFRWHAILETEAYYQTAEIDTRTGEIGCDPRRDVIFKPPATAATEAAKRTLLGQVYLDWGAWAVVRDVGPEPIPGPVPGLDPPRLPPNRQWTTVEFDDLRFDYPFLGVGQGAGRTPNRPPLSAWVYIVDGRDDAGEAMNGREQK